MKGTKILNMIDEEKDFVSAEWLEKNIHTGLLDVWFKGNEAREILDYGVQVGLLYESGAKYDIKSTYYLNKKGIEKFNEFINRFFKGMKIKDKIKKTLDKRELIRDFLEVTPIYYDKYKLWWMWNDEEFFWEKIDETDIFNAINDVAESNTINSKEKNELLEALRQESRKKKPLKPKSSWVQFQDKIIDINDGKEYAASSQYFISNPIKWKLGSNPETPEIDKLFISWVGEEHKEELYEILAFCLVPSYFIHRQFCLIGSGANGKSTFLTILEKFIGDDNITSSSLYLLLKQRFEGSKLLKKLVCMIGETNFNMITNTDLLKKITGEDTIRCEFKGKDGFDYKNYAKLIMATNSIPPTADKTDGFYRRWKIIEFPNKFRVESNVLGNIPEKEYENLALKCLDIAKRLWKDRVFTNDGTFEERKQRYEEKSNPLMQYIKEEYEKDIKCEVLFQEFFEGFNNYLDERGHRLLSAIAVSKQLKAEGFDIKTLQRGEINGRFILGLKTKG